MKISCLLCLALMNSAVSVSSLLGQQYGNAGLQTVEIITKYGYPVETHYVESEDGYITTLNRIPHNGTNVGGRRPVVFLQHGLLCSDNIFIVLGPKKSLGFLLADRGYDVWMGNARGSRYSRNHVNYTTKDKQYWDFSFHEMGFFDLPKQVDYILQQTGVKDITYIGHSMGNAISMILLINRPEYNEKIKFIIGLAPAIFVGSTASIPMHTLQKENGHLQSLSCVESSTARVEFYSSRGGLNTAKGLKMSLYGVKSVALKLRGNHEALLGDFDKHFPGYWKVCDPLLPTTAICRALYVSVAGLSSSVSQSSFPAIFSIFPTSTSSKLLAHYKEMGQKDAFRMYDYGPAKNRMLYNSSEPPDYDLSRVSVPVLIMYSDADLLATPPDVKKFNKFLRNSTLYRVPESKYNHLDFIFGETSVDHVYPKIFRTLQEV